MANLCLKQIAEITKVVLHEIHRRHAFQRSTQYLTRSSEPCSPLVIVVNLLKTQRSWVRVRLSSLEVNNRF